MKLRPYQQSIIQGIRQSPCRRNLVRMPCGTGKTFVAATLIGMCLDKGKRALLLAPRRELVLQTCKTLHALGIDSTALMAGYDYRPWVNTIVASWDTLYSRRERIPMPPADLVIVDECHLAMTRQRLSVLHHYDHAYHIGLSATPARLDNKSLGTFYQHMVHGWPVQRYISSGYLVPVVEYAPTVVDMDSIPIDPKTGDYQIGATSARVRQKPILGDVVKQWHRIARGLKTVCFAVDRAHGKALFEEFTHAGVSCAYVDAKTSMEDRQQMLSAVSTGAVTMLINVDIATYGLDIPALECAILTSKTNSIVRYVQRVGRIMRTYPGKQRAILIDHGGNVRQHGSCNNDFPWSLDGDVSIDSERRKRERKEPKEITCSACGYVFSGYRTCPNCGHEMIARGNPIPCWDIELELVNTEQARRADEYAAKLDFYSQMLGYAKSKHYSNGYAAHQYREKYGDWPNDAMVRCAEPAAEWPDALGWVKHIAIRRRYAKNNTQRQ